MRVTPLLIMILGLLLPEWSAGQPAVWEQKLDLHASCTPDAIVEILVIAAAEDGTVYASDQSHLYRTLDDGLTWDKAAFPISYIEGILPLDGDSLLIGVVGWAPGTSGVYRAGAYGDAWEKTTVNDPVDFITSRPDHSIIYAVDDYQGLFVSTDRGQSWTERFEDHNISSVVPGRYGLDYVNPGAWESADGLNWLQVPNATYTLYPTSEPGVFLRSGSEGVYRSTNNGRTWTLVLEADGGRLLTNALGYVLYVENRARLSVSLDQGLSWVPFANSIPEDCARVTEATLDASGRVWIGTLDGAVFRTSESAAVLSNEGEELPSEASLFRVYPNPASSYFVVDAETPVAGPKRVELYDVGGRSVLSSVDWIDNSRRIRIDVGQSSLPAGMYFVRISEGGTHTTIPVALIAQW